MTKYLANGLIFRVNFSILYLIFNTIEAGFYAFFYVLAVKFNTVICQN